MYVVLCVQVKLSNPSSKPLVYQAIVNGRDAKHFSLPKGRVVTIAPKSSVNVAVVFTSRFMRSCEAVLVMAGRRQGATSGCSLVFTLRAGVDSITPMVCHHSPAVSFMRRFPRLLTSPESHLLIFQALRSPELRLTLCLKKKGPPVNSL